VDASVPEQTVLDLFDTHGMPDVLSASSNEVPLFTTDIPLQAETFIPLISRYLESRMLFFFDTEKTVRLYYVPDGHSAQLRQLLTEIPGVSGSDMPDTLFPLMLPAVCAAVFLLFLLLSRERLLFTAIALPFFPFIYAVPLFSNAGAVCVTLLLVHLFRNVRSRSGALRSFFRRKSVLIFIACDMLLVCSGGIVSVLFFVLAALCAPVAAFLLAACRGAVQRQGYFSPVPIRPAAAVRITERKSVPPVAAVALSLAFLAVAAGLPAKKNATGIFDSLSIPVPTEYTDCRDFSADSYASFRNQVPVSVFPDFAGYIACYWTVQTFPFQSLNSVASGNLAGSRYPEKGDTVVMTGYHLNGDTVQETADTVFTFDDRYVADLAEKTAAQGPGLEQLLARQGSFVSASYNQGRKTVVSGSTVLIVVALYLSLGAVLGAVTVILLKGPVKNGRSN